MTVFLGGSMRVRVSSRKANIRPPPLKATRRRANLRQASRNPLPWTESSGDQPPRALLSTRAAPLPHVSDTRRPFQSVGEDGRSVLC